MLGNRKSTGRTDVSDLQYNQDWQTQARGTNDQEYQIYLSSVDSDGNDIAGNPVKTYDEWLNS